MCSCKYYDIMRKSKDKKFIRYQMVNHAKEYGIKPTARAFNTNVKTVRKWLTCPNRYRRVGTRPRQKDIVGLANGMAGRAGGEDGSQASWKDWKNKAGHRKTLR